MLCVCRAAAGKAAHIRFLFMRLYFCRMNMNGPGAVTEKTATALGA